MAIGLPTLLVGSFTTLVGLGVSSLLVSRAQARRDLFGSRMRRTLEPYRRSPNMAGTAASTQGVGMAQEDVGLEAKLTRLFGFDRMHQDRYIVAWPLALLGTLVLACIVIQLFSKVTGNYTWLAAPLAWAFFSRSFFGWCEQRRRNKLFLQFPDALAMIVRSVRVGIPVTDSLRAVGREIEAPTGPEFARMSDELSVGVQLVDALHAMAERNNLQEYRFFATALALQSQTGGGLSETLENLADVIRKRAAVTAKGHALSSEAKMSSLVLACLPPFAGAALAVLMPSYAMLMYSDPLGNKLFAAAVLLLATGGYVMRLLIRNALS